jgi:antitoxin component YwqK of YwqJK toxin-antitoxin module
MSELPMMRDENLDIDSELVATADGRPFTGIGYEESSVLGRSEVEYRNGVQEGIARDWYPSGVLKGESEYFQNTLHGVTRECDSSGRRVSETHYEYGIVVRRERFDSSGVVIEVHELDPNSGEAALLRQHRATHDWPR